MLFSTYFYKTEKTEGFSPLSNKIFKKCPLFLSDLDVRTFEDEVFLLYFLLFSFIYKTMISDRFPPFKQEKTQVKLRLNLYYYANVRVWTQQSIVRSQVDQNRV